MGNWPPSGNFSTSYEEPVLLVPQSHAVVARGPWRWDVDEVLPKLAATFL